MIKNNIISLVLFTTFLFTITACRTQEKTDLKFAFLTDVHVAPGAQSQENFKKVIQEINSSDLDFVVITGDISNSGSNDELMTVKHELDELTIPYHIIPGNHETNWSESAGQKFVEIWGNDRFIIEWKDYLLIGFSTGPYMKMGDGHIKQEDLQWLKTELAGRDLSQKTLFSFAHYPLADGLDNWFEATDILKANDCKAAFCGHGHQLKLQNFYGIPGIMGRSLVLRNSEIPGYNIVEIRNDSLLVYEKIINEPLDEATIAFSLDKPEVIKDLPVSSRPDFSVNNKYPTIKETFSLKDTASIFTGLCLVGDSMLIYGNSLGWLKAIHHKNNEEVWQTKFNGAIYSTPAIDQNILVFGAIDGHIYGLNAQTGETIWKVLVGTPVLASPVIHGNNVYIGGGSSAFYSINITTGQINWQYKDIEGLIQAKATLEDNYLVFGAWDRHLYCLSASTGELLWKWNNDRPNLLFSPGNVVPAISHQKVFLVAPDRYMTALHLKTGQQVWRTNKHQVRESLAISPDGNEVFAKLMNDSIVSVSTLSNQFKTNWVVDAGIAYDHNPCPPLVTNTLVIGATKNGFVTSINRSDQSIAWQHKAGNSSINSLQMDTNNNLWISSMEGKIIQLRYSEE